MLYTLRNGEQINIREIEEDDAERVLYILDETSKETKFLSRNEGEIYRAIGCVENEKEIIRNNKSNPYIHWFVIEYNGEVVGQCSVVMVRNSERYLHRGELGFVLLEKACNKGIGGKMMTHCLNKCREMGILQAELSVVSNNKRALKMYKGFGFKRIGVIPRALRYLDGSFADEYKMIKFLDS